MQAKLLPLLRCPVDGSTFKVDGELQAVIEEGTLVCQESGHYYQIKRGMPYLYVDDELWQPKAQEAIGWVKYHQDRNIYDQTDVDIDFQLPYFPHAPWIEVARQFDIALDMVRPKPGEWVLDVGAGRGWAAKQFALRGCQAVAIEIVDDEQVGLGRARTLMNQANVMYDTMIADSERLPFAEGSFDIVFCAAALHHTTNLAVLLGNISRVLRPGGRMIAINEPCIPDKSDDEELRRTELAEELSYGINETRPRLDDYRRVIRQAGLIEEAMLPWQAYGATQESISIWTYELGLSPLAASLPEQHGHVSSSEQERPGPGVSRMDSGNVLQSSIDYLLRECGGSLILLARK